MDSPRFRVGLRLERRCFGTYRVERAVVEVSWRHVRYDRSTNRDVCTVEIGYDDYVETMIRFGARYGIEVLVYDEEGHCWGSFAKSAGGAHKLHTRVPVEYAERHYRRHRAASTLRRAWESYRLRRRVAASRALRERLPRDIVLEIISRI